MRFKISVYSLPRRQHLERERVLRVGKEVSFHARMSVALRYSEPIAGSGSRLVSIGGMYPQVGENL